MGQKVNAYRIFVEMPEGKKPLGRPRRRWEDVRIDLRKILWGGMNWIQPPHGRDQCMAVVNTAMNPRVP
jgi:hypothetical protein